MSGAALRPYRAGDEEAALALWAQSWRATFPDMDWDARLDWWRVRWREELVVRAEIVVAEVHGILAGFVTIEPDSGYLDQIVVGPAFWGRGIAEQLLDAARGLSPARIDLKVNKDNGRAVAFYQRQGFAITGEGTNPGSGLAIYAMRWTPLPEAARPA